MRMKNRTLAVSAAGTLLLCLLLGVLFSACEETVSSTQAVDNQTESCSAQRSERTHVLCYLFPRLPDCQFNWGSIEPWLEYPGSNGWRPL